MADAEPGSRWQLERVGYFVVDAVDSRPGAPVLNRIVTLRDSWHSPAAESSPPAQEREPAEKSTKAKTRPARKSRVEYRAEARLRQPVLAERHAAWPSGYGISESDADLLTGDLATGDLFAAAVSAGASAPAVARWIVNDLPPALGDRELHRRPPSPAPDWPHSSWLLSRERSPAVAGKEVLSAMVETGSTPEQIIAARGLTQVSDESALGAIVDEVILANPDKATAYRGGKTALLGFFVGQTIKASQGKANPQVVQKLLTERLQ